MGVAAIGLKTAPLVVIVNIYKPLLGYHIHKVADYPVGVNVGLLHPPEVRVDGA